MNAFSHSLGRTRPYDGDHANDCFRRIFLLAAHPGEGPLTDPTAAVQAWWPERVLMPQSSRLLGL